MEFRLFRTVWTFTTACARFREQLCQLPSATTISTRYCSSSRTLPTKITEETKLGSVVDYSLPRLYCHKSTNVRIEDHRPAGELLQNLIFLTLTSKTPGGETNGRHRTWMHETATKSPFAQSRGTSFLTLCYK